jgi:hypothetical protein
MQFFHASSGFAVEACNRYSADKHLGAKVIVTKDWLVSEALLISLDNTLHYFAAFKVSAKYKNLNFACTVQKSERR